MDIYLQIKLGKESLFGICIENKPYAGDQKNQVKDYGEELEKRHQQNFHMIYLCESGEPSTDSIPDDLLNVWKHENRSCFSHVKFSDLIPWLNVCKLYCQNHSVIEFLNQFIKFIQKQFMGIEDMNEQEEILQIILANPNNISSALQIYSNIFEMKRRLVVKLYENFQKYNPRFGKTLYELSKSELTGKIDDKIMFKIPESELTISLAFNGTGFNLPYIGIFLPNKNLTDDSDFAKKILKQTRENLSNPKLASDLAWRNGSWLAWYYFDNPDFYIESKFWANIDKEETIKFIYDEVNKLYNILGVSTEFGPYCTLKNSVEF